MSHTELGTAFGVLKGQTRAGYSGSFFVFLEGLEMGECNFKCLYNSFGECLQGGGECIGEDCPDWKDCGSCKWTEECEI